MSAKVGDYLRHDPLKLRFTTCNSQTGAPKNVVRRSPSHAVAELIQPSYQQAPTNTLFYELLEISLVELETKKNVRITWMGVHNKEEVSRVPPDLCYGWMDG
jgi:ubiquitin carboxyl-terminal hydrolase 7